MFLKPRAAGQPLYSFLAPAYGAYILNADLDHAVNYDQMTREVGEALMSFDS